MEKDSDIDLFLDELNYLLSDKVNRWALTTVTNIEA